MIAEAFGGGGIDQTGIARFDRRVRVVVAACAFENVAAVDLFAAQIAGLPRRAAQLVVAIVMGLKLVIADRPIRNRHIIRDRAFAVTFGDRATDAEIAR